MSVPSSARAVVVLGLVMLAAAIGCETPSPAVSAGPDGNDDLTDAATTDANTSTDARVDDAQMDARSLDAAMEVDAARLDAARADAGASDAATIDASPMMDAAVTNDDDAGADDAAVIDPLAQWDSGVCGFNCDCGFDDSETTWTARGSIRGDHHQANETQITRATVSQLRELKRLRQGAMADVRLIGRKAYLSGWVSFVRGAPPVNYLTVLADNERMCVGGFIPGNYTLDDNRLITQAVGSPVSFFGPGSTPGPVDWQRTAPAPEDTYSVPVLMTLGDRVVEWRHKLPAIGYGPQGSSQTLTGPGSAELWSIVPATGEATRMARVEHACGIAGEMVIDAASQTAVFAMWHCFPEGVTTVGPGGELTDAKLFALDLQSGAVRWEQTLAGYPWWSNATPPPAPMLFTYADDGVLHSRVAIGDSQHAIRVFALESGDEDEVWSMPRPGLDAPNGDTHYSHDGTHVLLTRMHCTDVGADFCMNRVSVVDWLDSRDASPVRTLLINGVIPAISSTPELTFINAERILVLDNATGQVLWSLAQEGDTAASVAAPIAIADGQAYVPGRIRLSVLGVE